MSETKRLRTRCYYSEYVNHMIRFYISCPECVLVEGKRQSDINNWIAVQAVMHALPEEKREMILSIYRKHYFLPKAVEMYCEETGAKQEHIWTAITKVTSMIAKRRGLV